MSTYNNKKKKYEVWNYVPEDRDSILELPIEEVIGGQVFVSEEKIRDIVNEELDKRLGMFRKDEY